MSRCVGSKLTVPEASSTLECGVVFAGVFYFLVDDADNFLVDSDNNLLGAN